MKHFPFFSARAVLATGIACAGFLSTQSPVVAAEIPLSGLLAHALGGQWPDLNDDGRLQPHEAAQTKHLEVRGHFADLSELRHFPNLEILDINDNDALTRLDASKFPRLLNLSIRYCRQFDQIDGLAHCRRLEAIEIYETGLLAIDVRGLTALRVLDVKRNKLESIESSGLTQLTVFSDGNPLTGRSVTEARAAGRVLDFSVNRPLLELLARDSNVDRNGDDKIQAAEAAEVTDLSFTFSGVRSLEGLQHFKNLRTLYLYLLEIETLDLTDLPALEELHVCAANLGERPRNSIKNLTVSGGRALRRFAVSESALDSLALRSLPALQELDTTNNGRIQKIDARGLPRLARVTTDDSPLRELHLESATALQTLEIREGDLGRLDLTGFTQLKTLRAPGCGIRELLFDALPALEEVDLSRNKLTQLDFTRVPTLRILNMNGNPLVTLNVFGLSRLEKLDASSADTNRGPTLMSLNLGGTVSLREFSW
jgi:Leucine-rich repeat (LRR) protein